MSTEPTAQPDDADLPADAATESAPAPYVPPEGPVVAKAGAYFRNARYLMVLLMVGLGGWFLKDGFYAYPKDNADRKAAPEAKRAEMKEHSDLDILLQKLLGFALPPIGLILLARWLHMSRGRIILDNGVVSIPGHPPFALDDVTKLDKRLWDRKGIAYVEYQTSNGVTGRATLDDFIYDRKPIDLIYDAIVHNLQERAAQASAE